ncbi:hypothetical protein RCL1_001754 [Eukaryota sp. TZLM3-RCL]
MASFVQVIGSSAPDASPSLLIFFESKRYIFNTGDGFQRFALEHKVRLSKIDHFFFSSLSCVTLGGLSGLLLTVFDMGVTEVNLHGPQGLSDILSSIKDFIHRPSMTLNIFEFTPNQIGPCFSDLYISVYSLPSSSSSTHCSFIVSTPDLPGEFSVAKAKSFGLLPGPVYAQLKSGKSVLAPNGSTVHPDDVMAPSQPGTCFTIFNLDSVESVNNLLESEKFLNISNLFPNIRLSIHFFLNNSWKNLAFSPEYKQLVSLFPESTNLISSPAVFYCQNPSSTFLQKLLAQYFKDYFLVPNDTSIETTTFSQSFLNELRDFWSRKVEPATTLTKFILSPAKKMALIMEPIQQSIEKKLQGLSDDCILDLSINISDQIKQSIVEKSRAFPVNSGGVLFLGTGSAVPSKYRNVSSTLVAFDFDPRLLSDNFDPLPRHSVLLFDCGEGTFAQMHRVFKDRINDILISISVICISHDHADHNLGLWRLLFERNKIIQNLPHLKVDPLLLIAPKGTISFINRIQLYEDLGGNSNFIVKLAVPCSLTRLDSPWSSLSINIIPVEHSAHSVAFVIKKDLCSSPQQVSISFSGDCRPSEAFAMASSGCNVMIHESTFDDSMQADAIDKNHSTFSEALGVGRIAAPDVVTLTHFSQRYPRFVAPEVEAVKYVVANDFFFVPFCDVLHIPLLMPFLELVFSSLDEGNNTISL